MKRTIVGIALLTVAASIAGCDTAPTDEPTTPQPTAVGDEAAIEKARKEGFEALPPEAAAARQYLNEPLSLPPQPQAKSGAGDIETQTQAISWSCRLRFYPQPQWWSGVGVLQILKSDGVLKSQAQCQDVFRKGALGVGALAASTGDWIYIPLIYLVWSGANCACDYVF